MRELLELPHSIREVDITVDAQKILSCIRRTGERFGKKTICEILRGSKNEKIIRLGLDSQTTYGIMKEYKEAEVREIIDFLEFEGYVESVGTEYPTLAIRAKSSEVLFGGSSIKMKRARPKPAAVKESKKKKFSDTVDHSLLADLKALRREIADSKNVPAYIVFSDATLIDMCKRMPETIDEMLNVSGVGKVKLELYGERFLKVLKSR